MRPVVLLLVLGSVLATATAMAQEQPRLALLIGNKGYTANVGPLKNPHNDVDLIESSLKRLGFKVTVLKDASYKAMDTALKRYVTEVRRAGQNALSFFYYSGHGVANPETQINYLIPVDVADADDDKVWFESFQQTAIIDLLSRQAANATHYVVFDACRNELNVAGTAAKALGTDKGFVPITDTAGLLIAYATAPRKTASDFGDGGGPYAKALAAELVKPGIEAVTMFRNVQLKVKQTIGQDPWLSFPSLPPVYLAGPRMPEPGASPLSKSESAPGTAGTPTTYEQQAELAMWASLKDSKDPVALQLYLDRYPKGAFADLAKLMIAQARREADARHADAAKRAAEAQRTEAEQKARAAETARQQDQLRQALEEARLAREASKAAERDRLAAEKAAQEAREALKKQQIAVARPPATSPAPAPPGALNWYELGCQSLSKDDETIRLGRQSERFRAIRLRALGLDIQMSQLRVFYNDGPSEDIPVGAFIRAGERTRPLDLKGDERSLDRLDLVYRFVPTSSGGKAAVCVEGLR
jgi:uncharacterized caspase-like protein